MLKECSGAVLALGLVLPAQAPEKGKLELELMLNWENVGSPSFSPDGTKIVFTRSWTNAVEDRMQRDVYMMNSDGTRPVFFMRGGSPQFSPDGTRVAYTAQGDPGGSQIHVMWVDTKESTQITHLIESPSGIKWSPDGKQIMFTMRVDAKEGFPITLPKKPKGAQWAPEPRVVTRLNYRRDGSGFSPIGFSHVFVVDAEGGTERQITSGDWNHRGGEWTPDGKNILFSGLRVEDAEYQRRESEIYSVSVETKEITQLTDRPGGDSGPVPSPDGRWIAYSQTPKNEDTYNGSQLFVMRADGTRSRSLTPNLDRRPGGFTWSEDSSTIYFSVSRDGDRVAYKVNLNAEVEQLTGNQQQFSMSDVAVDGRIVGTFTTPQKPSDIWIRQPNGTMQQLTRVNDDILADVQLGEVEEIHYKSVGDLDIEGWIVKPPDFDPNKKYPLILQIHGGPHGMYGGNFDFERQNHAANGFVLLYTNPRGSSGYGKSFGNEINNAYPSYDYDDLMNGVDEVISRGYIDEDNLFVYGGSGGGVLTAWIVGHTDRFAGAVSMYPVINWISFVGTTDGSGWYHNFKEMPWDNIEEHWTRSPLKYAGNVTTPTMLLTGELDLRTPMGQTEEFYMALKMQKVDSVMVRVPDEYHGASGRHLSNRLRRILYVRGWFEKYMTGDSAQVLEASKGK